MEEIWKDVIGYESHYKVSNLGNVKSFKYNKQKILKSSASGYYLTVALRNNNKSKTYLVHQLVAITFLYHKPNGINLVVDHINDIKTDNRLDNLQVITQRENACKTQGNYSSKYKGVCWDKRAKKWKSAITISKKIIHLGYFTNELEAHNAYQNKLKQI